MSKQLPRYPGAQPFETDQQGIFFGRQKDVESLGRLVRQEPLTVLYSKSGMGKSSLLNAGVIPAIQAEGEYRPLRFRFNAFDKDAPLEGQPMPATRTMETIRGGKESATTFLDRLIENEKSLWHDLKEQQILAFQAQQLKTPISQYPNNSISQHPTKLLLVFDQFEELFTYPPEAVLAFRKQLAEALYTPLPRRYWDMLDLYGKEQSPLSHDEQTLLETPLDLRVVVAIRQDRMHLLGNLNDYLPSISKTWFELQPLNERQAGEAITQPAALVGNYFSNPFQYEEQALADILHFLTKGGKEKIESTQLQIVCNSLERKAAAQKMSHICPTDVGDLDAVIENYYLEKIASIGDEEEQLAARRLVEEGLVYEEEERRLSLYEGIILKVYDIAPDTLRKLVDSHLLRAEPSLQGGYTYELSHDTLVAPVLKAKAKRMAAEKLDAEREALRIKELELADLRRKAEEERLKAEQERQLREQAELAKEEAETQRLLAQKNERWARARTRVAGIVSLIALSLALIAGYSYLRAGQARAEADKSAALAKAEAQKANDLLAQVKIQKDSTEEQRKIAVDKSKLAELKTIEANANLVIAEAEKNKAKRNLAEKEAALIAKEKAEQEKQKAEIKKMLNEALVFERAQEYPHAITWLKAVLRRDSTNSEAKRRLKKLEEENK
jgi:hypothetical protein